MVECCKNCFECEVEDCPVDYILPEERKQSNLIDTEVLKSREPAVITMQRYIHNRPDKEAHIKARNREYERKRGYRKEAKRQQYLRHREKKLEYQKTYYEDHKEEVLARQKAIYYENREEILEKRREKYLESHPRKPKQTLEERREKQRQYRLEHRDEINRKKREAYRRNKEVKKVESNHNK